MQKYANSVQMSNGDAVAGATITVTTTAGGAVTVYSDNVGTPYSPVLTDALGMYYFYAPDGRYNITVSGNGINLYTLTDIQVDDSLVNVPTTSVVNVADLKNVSKTSYLAATTSGYYTKSDGGGANYYLDATDTTSADNGGSIIVATDGGRWKLISDGVNVKQWGAKGDGSTDDLTRLQVALSYVALNGLALYIPTGRYVSSGLLTVVCTKNITIFGDGRGTSEIVFTNSASCGMDITIPYIRISPSMGSCSFHDFGLVHNGTTNAPTGTALKITQQEGTTGAEVPVTVSVTNVDAIIDPSVVASNSWFNGFWFKRLTDVSTAGGGCLTHVHNCGVMGRSNNPDPAGSGFIFDTAVGSRVSQCIVYWMDKGLEVNGYTEGPDGILNCTFIACNWGVYASTVSDQPGLSIIGCHLNTFKGGVYLVNRVSPIISNSLFYQRTESLDTPYYDIYMDGGSGFNFHHNICGASSKATTPANFVGFMKLTGSIIGGHVSDNFVRNRQDVGVDIGASTQYITIADNDFQSCVPQVIDGRTRPYIDSKISLFYAPDCSQIICTGTVNQSIPDNTATDITLFLGGGSTYSNGGSTLNTTTGEFTIADGVQKVVVKCQVAFANNAAGYRQIKILKNGAAGKGYPFITAAPATGVTSIYMCGTAPIDVVPGDKFKIEVLQTSGGALNLIAAQTWASVEVVA